MTATVLSASPSWYCSRALDCNKYGVTCYAAKNSVYAWDTCSEPPRLLTHFLAHQERVVGISLSHFEDASVRCCTTGEDGKVKIWDIESATLLEQHDQHFQNSRKPTSIHWSTLDKDLIVSGDDRGTLIVWRPSHGVLQQSQPEPASIFCLACSPHDHNLVAIGYKTGTVLLVNISSKSHHAVQKLRGHDEEIHCLVWSPVLGEDIEWNHKQDTDQTGVSAETVKAASRADIKGALLATGSRDRTIRVWNIAKGKALHILKLPTNTGHSRGSRYDDTNKARVWVTLYWLPSKPTHIVSSSFNGELLMWDIGRGKPLWKQFTAGPVNKGHSRIVFNLAAGGADGKVLCSTSMDRQLVVWDMDLLTATWALPTQGGFVYSLALSPLQPGRLAVGAGDGVVRVWHTDNTSNPFNIQSFWQGIKGKVTSLSWHPSKEGRLAYGTDDGRVGFFDVLTNRPPDISSTYHKRTVYVVTWGPPCYAKTSEPSKPTGGYSLYSCGDGVVLIHSPQSLDRDAVNITSVMEKPAGRQGRHPNRSEISWKPDFSVAAIGNDDGSIDLLSAPHLTLVASVQVHHKLINCLRWHPAFTAVSSQPSQCSAWLASGSNEAIIHVTDLTKPLVAREMSAAAMVITESFCQLEGHTNRITGLSWSSHTEGLLASASYDWTAQIWDVKQHSARANYRGHHGRLLSVQWSDADPDLVYTGGEDFSLHAWQPSQLKHNLPPTGKEKKKLKGKRKGNNKVTSSEAPGTHEKTGKNLSKKLSYEEELAEVKAMIETRKAQLTNESQTSELSDGKEVGESAAGCYKARPEDAGAAGAAEEDSNDGGEADELGSNLAFPSPKPEQNKKDLRDRRKRRARSLFPTSSVMDNRGKLPTQDDCVELAKAIYSDDELPSNLLHLGCFVDRHHTFTMLHNELEHHGNHQSTEQQVTLQMFTGNITGLLKSAAEAKKLNDHLMSLAALASVHTWRELCGQYAEQLEAEGQIHKASTYLLAACRVYDTIKLFHRHSLYKEAVCLSRARLSPSDPAIIDAYTKWGSNLARDGNFEMAAKCFLSAKDPVEASRMLAKRNEQPALRSAVLVSLAAGEISTAKMYGQKYIQQCMQSYDWVSALSIVQEDSCFQVLGLVVRTHEVLLRELLVLRAIDDKLMENAKWSCPVGVHSPSSKTKLPSLLMNMSSGCALVPWQMHSVSGEACILHLVRLWSGLGHLELGVRVLENAFTQLQQLADTRQSQPNLTQWFIDTAFEVSLGSLKLLLGDTECAAKHYAVALASFDTPDILSVGQGLCQILLPRGPDHLWKLQQQVRALRISSGSERPHLVSVHDVVSPAGGDTSIPSDESVNNSQDTCSPTDCLHAMYYWNVVQFLLQQQNESKPASEEEHKGRKGGAEEEHKGRKGGAEEENEGRKGGAEEHKGRKGGAEEEHEGRKGWAEEEHEGRKGGAEAHEGRKEGAEEEHEGRKGGAEDLEEEKLGLEDLQHLSSALLWDVQARYYEYRETLVHIQQATAALVSKHAPAAPTDTSPSEPDTSPTELDTSPSEPDTSPSVQDASVRLETVYEVPKDSNRRHSGEYLDMTSGYNKSLSIAIPKPRPHEMILRSPSKTYEKNAPQRNASEISNMEEYVPMYPENHQCTALCMPFEHSSPPICARSRSLSGSNAADFFLASPQVSVDENQSTSTSVQSVDEEEEGDQLFVDLPESWLSQPVDVKFKHDKVTLPFLSQQHLDIVRKIASLNLPEGCPFPSPLESAMSLAELACARGCEKEEGMRAFVRAVADWANRFSYLQNTRVYFRTLLHSLDPEP